MTYSNESPEATLPRFSEGLKLEDSERFERNQLGVYSVKTTNEVINTYGKRAGRAIIADGGTIYEDMSDDRGDLIVILPAGTTVTEYHVPRARNTQDWIAYDCVIRLPSGTFLVFEQYGWSDSIWVADGELTDEELRKIVYGE